VARCSKPPELITWASFCAARILPQGLAEADERLVIPIPRPPRLTASGEPRPGVWQELRTSRSAGSLSMNRTNAARPGLTPCHS
jgi:hypothetical protein